MPEPNLAELPAFCLKPTLILGCGNILFGDDGFGCAVVEHLEAHFAVPEDVCLLDVGTGVRKVLFTLCLSPERPRRVLILDALDVGREPGELFEISPNDIPANKCDDFSLHQLPTSNLLRELEEECGVEVRVLGCQTATLPAEICPGLSGPVLSAVPKVAEHVAAEYFTRTPAEREEEALSPYRLREEIGLPRSEELWQVRDQAADAGQRKPVPSREGHRNADS